MGPGGFYRERLRAAVSLQRKNMRPLMPIRPRDSKFPLKLSMTASSRGLCREGMAENWGMLFFME